MKKVFVSFLLLILVFTSFGSQAFAADDPSLPTNPPYHVRVFQGNSDVGELDINPIYEEVDYGESYSFNEALAQVTVKDDERYYVKGFREAGKDDSDRIYTTVSLPIERDMDYVVAYGMKGSAVAYTVNFVDANGATLAPSQTFYANVGDRPVVSYIYIEDYQPQAYALTKKLTDDPADNVFTFTYIEIADATTVVIGGGGAAVLPVGGNAGANAGGNAAQPAAPAQPETIIDLDVPLAAPDEATTESGTGVTSEPGTEPEAPKDTKLSSWILYVLALGGIALLIAFLIALLRRRKPSEEITREDLEGALEDAKKEVNEGKDKK